MKSENINLMVAENYIVREGLKSLLQREKNIKITGESTTGAGIVDLLISVIKADIILTDVNLPDMDALKLTGLLNDKFPQVKVLILTAVDNDSFILKTLQAGVKGYLLKSVSPAELTFALLHLRDHDHYVCASLTLKFINRLPPANQMPLVKTSTATNFSNREIAILTLISQGFTNYQISEELFASKRTIENCRQGLIDKTGSRNIISLVRFALLSGLIS